MQHPTSTWTDDPRDQELSRDAPPALKKRASVACQRCRSRKVRCDLKATGAPCHNCRLDQAQCVVVASRRSREYRAEKARLSLAASIHKQNATPTTDPEEQGSSPRDFPAGIASTAAPGTSALGQTSNEDARTHGPTSAPPLLSPYPETTSQRHDTNCAADQYSSLPTFIARPERELRLEELRFLRDSAALTIPHSGLRDQLLLSFVLYVDPHLPVVDIQALLDSIEGRSKHPVSLLLFQAVMFAGSHFVSMNFLEEAGFETRVAAKAYYFRQIKVGYPNSCVVS